MGRVTSGTAHAGLSKRWRLEATVPFVDRAHIHDRNRGGRAAQVDDVGLLGSRGRPADDRLAGVHFMRTASLPTSGGGRAFTPIFLSALGRLNGRGTEDYRVGRELQFCAGRSYPLARPVTLLAQVNARFRGRDETGGPMRWPRTPGALRSSSRRGSPSPRRGAVGGERIGERETSRGGRQRGPDVGETRLPRLGSFLPHHAL